jgi:hypothetical protein
MWQYTNGEVGPEPHSVTGIGNCDRDMFNGQMDGLTKLWGYAPTASTDTSSDSTDATTAADDSAAPPA